MTSQETSDEFALKPMNCPMHAMLFKEENLSYKSLPYKIAEFGVCFRNENTGGLNGLKRARKFTVDDGHIFCKTEHIFTEIQKFLKDADIIYKDFGFDGFEIYVSTRPEKSIGDKALWDQAEKLLIDAIGSRCYFISPGDGAFYGPKIELKLRDNLGRLWQCGTIQIDFFLSTNLDVSYKDFDNCDKYPVVLHRAIVGSLERFIGVLLENGPLPLWLQPTQVQIVTIAPEYSEYANYINSLLSQNNIQTEMDLTDNSISKKIKLSIAKRIPYIIILGEN